MKSGLKYGCPISPKHGNLEKLSPFKKLKSTYHVERKFGNFSCFPLLKTSFQMSDQGILKGEVSLYR